MVPVSKENEDILKYNPEAKQKKKQNGSNGSQKDYINDEDIKME